MKKRQEYLTYLKERYSEFKDYSYIIETSKDRSEVLMAETRITACMKKTRSIIDDNEDLLSLFLNGNAYAYTFEHYNTPGFFNYEVSELIDRL